MRVLNAGAARFGIVSLAVVVAGLGCGAKPPYGVSETPIPSRQQLQRLGPVRLADANGTREAVAPRVWIGVPDRRAEGAVLGGVVGLAAGAAVGGAAASPGGGMFAGLAILAGAALGAPVGVAFGAPIGATLGIPGKEARRAAAELRTAAESVDVGAAARVGAAGARRLAADGAGTVGQPHATIDVRVIAYGTRAAGGGRVRPFVAVRTTLTDAADGRIIYDATRDWRGPRRKFARWADGNAAEFRRVLEEGARRMGRRSVDRLLAGAGKR